VNPVLTLKHILVRQGPTFRLEIEHLDICKGTLYCLTGPNGAGKTTLLRLMALLTPPEAGDLFLDGKRVPFHGGAVNAGWRREITLVQQSPYLFNCSVHDNLAFGLKLRGIDAREQRNRIRDALNDVGLDGFAQRPARELSGGEIQRVALARAMVLKPQILLLDEPLANIDAKHLGLFETLLKALCAEQGITLVMSTHDPGQPLRLESSVIALDGGRLSGFTKQDEPRCAQKEIHQWQQASPMLEV